MLVKAVCGYFILQLGIISSFAEHSQRAELGKSRRQQKKLLNSRINTILTPGEECYRPCIEDGVPLVCHFQFVMEYYQAMGSACGECAEGEMEDCFNLHCITADGVEKGVMSINRKIPGPEIHVCKGDLIVVDVINQMSGTTTALHWHGIHQRETPFMDGVPFITQCPIDFGTKFRYAFRANESGTQFYHSHAGHHKVNGHYGALIVRTFNETYSILYDYDLKEHTIILSDWMHQTSEMFARGLPTKPPGPLPVNVLINGKGTFIDEDGVATKSPVQVYKVESGKYYRFRLIDSAALECPIEIQVQGHNLTIIATDGQEIEPVTADTLITAAGERYDFIIEANQEIDDYCIKIKLLGECDEDGGIEQYGVLSYSNNNEITVNEHKHYAKVAARCRKIGHTIIGKSFVNHPNMTCNDPTSKHLCPTDLVSLNIDETLLNATVDQQIFLAFDNYEVKHEDVFQVNVYEHFLTDESKLVQAAINNISFTHPSISILTQINELNDDMFCDVNNIPERCSESEICMCTHRIKIKLNSVVEMVLIDDRDEIGPENHPFHMHGYLFTVVEMGQDKQQLMSVPLYKRLKRENKLPIITSSSDAVLKDTVNIPSNGYAVIRFRADNPGFWLLHCHFEWHMVMGMTTILQVGEPTDFVTAPQGFPTCGNYVPEVYTLIKRIPTLRYIDIDLT